MSTATVPMLAARRTHSVHHTKHEAALAAHNLAHLMNGVPPGFVFAIQEKMGKFAFISLPVDAIAKAEGSTLARCSSQVEKG